jgi:hypothetical protein
MTKPTKEELHECLDTADFLLEEICAAVQPNRYRDSARMRKIVREKCNKLHDIIKSITEQYPVVEAQIDEAKIYRITCELRKLDEESLEKNHKNLSWNAIIRHVLKSIKLQNSSSKSAVRNVTDVESLVEFKRLRTWKPIKTFDYDDLRKEYAVPIVGAYAPNGDWVYGFAADWNYNFKPTHVRDGKMIKPPKKKIHYRCGPPDFPDRFVVYEDGSILDTEKVGI